ncbi:MAG: flavoprotein family/uncharacterized flavoprotein family [Bacteroidetes bacterium]|nr:flavoprotein family/uncharacterized flavoprotein family [Bacteroidota bacterium]MDF2452810.1 flavoprotein family/uncharacterized flavoprotein family [Bacteroidota bacterium]
MIIIGGGPASLMLACSLDSMQFNISIYEKNAALGRKFLVAGKGGFNLTHSENIEQFAQRYHPREFIKPFLNHFSNTDFRNWLQSIGIETYVGTSKRVFPVKGIKPIEVLKSIEKKLAANDVKIFYNHEWKGWNEDQLVFETLNHQTSNIQSDITVFALGGASWKVTGSDGNWSPYFMGKGIQIDPFYPSNCAYQINWNIELLKNIEGQSLKNCTFTCGSIARKGEAVITNFGIEGSGIYPMSPAVRKQLSEKEMADIRIDFKPDLSEEEIRSRIENKGKLSVKEVLEKRINLPGLQIELIKQNTTKEEYKDARVLTKFIKSYPLVVTGLAPLDEAISTVGGIPLSEVNQNLELKKLPNHYCIGEMLDWDAPTGGYLLQACFSMGKFLADKLNAEN